MAVRSSATAEDLPEAAFAGQQETFLDVVGGKALLDAVRRCWASLWNDRAIAYRDRLGLDQGTVKLADVVQRMVAAEAAGVLFTANPVTGARGEVVIDASPGLGEAVVAGLVTPDRYVLRKRWRSWRIKERRLGRREVVVRAVAAGGTEQVTPDSAMARGPALPDRASQRLASLGAAIERHFGAPQDVEWAWADGRLFILQARPITALPEPPPHPRLPQRLLANLVAELIPARPYPLEATTWGFEYIWTALLEPMFRPVGLAVRLAGLFHVEDGVLVRLAGRFPLRPTWRVLLAPLRLRQLSRRCDPTRWRDDLLLREALRRARALEARDLGALPWEGPLDAVREALAVPPLVGEIRRRYLLPRLPAMAGLRLLLGLPRAGDRFGTLLSTGRESLTLEINRELEALAARIHGDPALAEVFANVEASRLWTSLEGLPAGREILVELGSFLDRHGHREAGGTIQISQPTWKDVPEVCWAYSRGWSPPRLAQGWSESRGKWRATSCYGIPCCASRRCGRRSCGCWRRHAGSPASARTPASVPH